MKYGVEMTSSGMMYVPIFIWIGSDFQKFLGRVHTNTDT
jgi:hypothetical protein